MENSLASKRLFSSLAPQVMIAIGGWNEGSTKYSGMAKDKKKRQKFVNSTIDFLQKHNFDGIFKILDANLPKKGGLPPPPSSSSSSSGLDLDWEYPAKRGGSPQDKKNFILLVKELKEVNVSKINFFKNTIQSTSTCRRSPPINISSLQPSAPARPPLTCKLF